MLIHRDGQRLRVTYFCEKCGQQIPIDPKAAFEIPRCVDSCANDVIAIIDLPEEHPSRFAARFARFAARFAPEQEPTK